MSDEGRAGKSAGAGSPEGASSGSTHVRGTLIVAAGVLVLSPDALLVRLVGAGVWEIIFWRSTFSAVSLGTVLAVRYRSDLARVVRAMGGAGFVSSLLFGASSFLFVSSIVHTRVANVLAILATAPFFASLFARLILHEAVPRRTWLAIPLAVGGIGLIFGGSLVRDPGLLGELLALLLAVTLGGNLVTLRSARNVDMIPTVAIGAAFAALASALLASPSAVSGVDLGILALMGGAQLPLALVLIAAIGTRYLPAPEVGLLMLGETILGPVWVWLVVGEQPAPLALVGACIVVATLVAHSALGVRAARLPA